MENCEEIRYLLSAYLDGELEESERIDLEEHLEDCPGCAEELAGLKESREILGSLEGVEPPPDFLSRVHSRLENQSSVKSGTRKLIFPLRLKIPLEVAGLAAAAVLIIYILKLSPEEQSFKSVPGPASITRKNEIDKSQKRSIVTDAADSERMLAAAPAEEEMLMLGQAAPASVLSDEYGGGGTETVELVLLIETEKGRDARMVRNSSFLLGAKMKNLRSEEEATPEPEKKKTPISRLNDLIAREGGEIISTEEKSDSLKRIIIQLPPDSYRSFLKDLTGIGELQPDQSVPSGEGRATYRIRLNYNQSLRESAP